MTSSHPPSGFDTSRWEAALREEAQRREGLRLQVLGQARAQLKAFFAGKQVQSVFLTGSILKPGNFFEFSDVDVAVEGLKEDYFAVLVALEELLDRQVDLIELEGCRFRDAILDRGLRII